MKKSFTLNNRSKRIAIQQKNRSQVFSHFREEEIKTPSFATIDKFIKVEFENYSWILFFPIWYFTKSNNGFVTRHPIRKTIQIERKHMDDTDFMQPLFICDIIEQVMVLHECIRKCSMKHKNCTCKSL